MTGRARNDVKEKRRNMDKKKLRSSMEAEQEGHHHRTLTVILIPIIP